MTIRKCILGIIAVLAIANTALIGLAAPIEVISKFNTPGKPVGIAVSGKYLYIADSNNLLVYDISNPSSPMQTGKFVDFSTRGNVAGVDLAGNKAYVVEGTSGLYILNVTNPSTPSKLYPPTPIYGHPIGVSISNNYLYVANSNLLLIYDLTDPSSPGQVSRFEEFSFGGEVRGVHATGDRVYIAAGANGVYILDVSNPSKPKQISKFSTLGAPRGVMAAGNYLYVADNNAFTVWDITTPAIPRQVAVFDQFNASEVSGVDISGDRAFIAAGSNGVYILRVPMPAGTPTISIPGTTFPAQTPPEKGAAKPTPGFDGILVLSGIGIIRFIFWMRGWLL